MMLWISNIIRLAGVDPSLRENGHEALPERLELLQRVPDLAHAHVAVALTRTLPSERKQQW